MKKAARFQRRAAFSFHADSGSDDDYRPDDLFSAAAARMSFLKGNLIYFITLVKIDRAPGVAFKAGVEQSC